MLVLQKVLRLFTRGAPSPGSSAFFLTVTQVTNMHKSGEGHVMYHILWIIMKQIQVEWAMRRTIFMNHYETLGQL